MLRNVVIVVFVLFAFSSINIFSQCPVQNNVISSLLGTAPERRALLKDGTRFVLPQDTRFRVKFNSDISSEVYKVGDIVQFTVVEDVFGVTMVNKKIKFDEDIKESEKIDTTDANLTAKFKDENLIIAIPKDTIGFGRVDRSKKAVPFFLNGKAKISAIIEYLILKDGTCVPLEMVNATDEVRKSFGREDIPRSLIPCKNVIGKLCIQGRRPTIKIGSPFVTGVSTTALVLAKDKTATDIATITAIQQSTTGGFADLIDGTNAIISDDFIYEVQNTKNIMGIAIGVTSEPQSLSPPPTP